MPSHLITIEGGGTRSTLSIYDANGDELYSRRGPSLHGQRLGIAQIHKRCRKLITEGLQDGNFDLQSIYGIGLAIAGADRESDQQPIRQALSSSFEDIPLLVTSDVRATHQGAFAGGNGILVIAGTGSIVMGYNGNRWRRAGGYGWRLGDEGSGHQIGVKGLRAVGRDYDGQQSTDLRQLLEQELEIDSRDALIRWTYDEDHSPSQIARFVVAAARREDPVCLQIVKNQIKQLTELVHSLSKVLSLPEGPVACHGGLFTSDFFYQAFREQLQKAADAMVIRKPQHNPRYGLFLMMKADPAFALS